MQAILIDCRVPTPPRVVMSASDPLNSIATFVTREAALLAPYALRSVDSQGRKHAEPPHAYRGPFQRDRDRILHSSAYRRLSGKMQVFTGEMGDYHRTRLTHTQEVASIARTLGRALRLNEDFVEALAMLHDIGHPPFGHAGEDALAECLRFAGGFSHNRQALVIVEELERRYPSFPGLNLTREVLAGQQARADKQPMPGGSYLEVQLVDAVDSLTYIAHDTDDAVKLELVTLEELASQPLIAAAMQVARQRYGLLAGFEQREAVVHELIDLQVTELLRHNAPRLAAAGFDSANAARAAFVLEFPEDIAKAKAQLQQFLYARVYRHPRLIEVRSEAQLRLKRLFAHYLAAPETLPERYRRRGYDVGLDRAAADYIAGMTDRFCEAQFRRYGAA